MIYECPGYVSTTATYLGNVLVWRKKEIFQRVIGDHIHQGNLWHICTLVEAVLAK